MLPVTSPIRVLLSLASFAYCCSFPMLPNSVDLLCCWLFTMTLCPSTGLFVQFRFLGRCSQFCLNIPGRLFRASHMKNLALLHSPNAHAETPVQIAPTTSKSGSSAFFQREMAVRLVLSLMRKMKLWFHAVMVERSNLYRRYAYIHQCEYCEAGIVEGNPSWRYNRIQKDCRTAQAVPRRSNMC